MKNHTVIDTALSCLEVMERWSVSLSRLVKIISENKIKEYSVISTRVNPSTGERLFICYEKPKISGFGGKIWISRDISASYFNIIEIEQYEKINPLITYKESEDAPSERFAEEDRLGNEGRCFDIECFEKAYAESQNQLYETVMGLSNAVENAEKLRIQLDHAQKRIAELESKIATGADPNLHTESSDHELQTTVNAPMWENTLSAILDVMDQIYHGEDINLKRDEFRAKISEKYSKYHSKAVAIAWQKIPDRFKSGRGRPLKKR